MAIWVLVLMNLVIILTQMKDGLAAQVTLLKSVALRGPGSLLSGYTYLTGTTRLNAAPWNLPKLDCPMNFGGCGSGINRPNSSYYFRQARITTPVGATYQVKVEMNFSQTNPIWITLLEPYTMTSSAPATLKLGFAASTGGSTNYHEIRNLSVTQQLADLTGTKSVQNVTTGGGSVSPGDQLLYTVVLKNNTGSAINNVHFTGPNSRKYEFCCKQPDSTNRQYH